MLFNNPEIIKSSSDLRIGGVDVDTNEINYLDYKGLVRFRMLKMVCEFVKDQMSEGLTEQDARIEALSTVYSYLNISNKTNDSSEEGIVDEIMKSDEFQKWDTNIYYRFMDVHPKEYASLVTTPIPVSDDTEFSLTSEEDEQSLWTILDGLTVQFNK